VLLLDSVVYILTLIVYMVPAVAVVGRLTMLETHRGAHMAVAVYLVVETAQRHDAGRTAEIHGSRHGARQGHGDGQRHGAGNGLLPLLGSAGAIRSSDPACRQISVLCTNNGVPP
jgi:hypothetical protein